MDKAGCIKEETGKFYYSNKYLKGHIQTLKKVKK
jgi:hypothetical protein